MLVSIGNRIRSLRNRRGLVQEELAKTIGISRQVLSNWERDYTPIDTEGITRLSKALDVSVGYIIHGVDDDVSNTQQIALALEDDEELLPFFIELSKRDDLKLLFSQVRTLKDETIRQIIRYIKFIEDEEDRGANK